MMKVRGRLTLPTDVDMVEETLKLKERLDADALRDCDGTQMPSELLKTGAKIYATYYTTRKDNEWAKNNPEEVQQEYLITDQMCIRDSLWSAHRSAKLEKTSLSTGGLPCPLRN